MIVRRVSSTAATRLSGKRLASGTSKDDLKEKATTEETRILQMSKEQIFQEVERKLTSWEEMKAGAGEWWKETKAHYIGGTKELCHNVKQSTKYGRKSLYGHILTRRERRLITRTLGDVFRVIPFSMFVIIPFMELLLPVALKLFPNMMPSTYDDPKRTNSIYAKRLSAQVELTKLLQDTLEEMTVTIQKQSACREKRDSARKLADFIIALKDPESTYVLSYVELKQLLPLFNSDLGLNKMHRRELIAMCRLLETPHVTFASEESLRIGLRMHLRRLKQDDIAIQNEGITSLTDKEVVAACKSRAIRVQDPPDTVKLRKELQAWISLSRQPGVSNSLMVLSRVLPIGGIREVARAAAEDAEQEKVQQIENTAEQRAVDEEQDHIIKEVYAKILAEEAKQEGTLNLPTGTHVFMMTLGDVILHKKRDRIINSIQKDAENLQDTAEEILELMGDNLEYKEEVKEMKGKCSGAMDSLEKKVDKSINNLKLKLLSEQDEFIASSAIKLQGSKDHIEPLPSEVGAKLSFVQEVTSAPGLSPDVGSKLQYTPVPSTDPFNTSLDEPATLDKILTAEEDASESGQSVVAAKNISEETENEKVEQVRHI
eukprot:TRINITY_DN11_c1_g1_i4.p1 TRINITY_DN11_c1_g1~~TRINITY_DN11_c1_g1_i4.p1  ORF type:complete len:617 (+),score=72.51 TRINITY_DN11_c1_g1_i4:51-1853(+)